MKVYEILDRFMLSRHDAVVCVNRMMLKDSRVRIISNQHIYVVDNGIPTERDSLGTLSNVKQKMLSQQEREILDFSQNAFVVGSIGRLSREKGYDVLIEAFATLHGYRQDSKLLLIGEGDEREYIEKLITNHRLQNSIMLTGYINDAVRLMSLMSVYVNSSLSEGLPITILEAMRTKIPIIATFAGGMPDALDQGRCGLLVPPGDKARLANALILLSSNAADNQRMIGDAYRRFESRYTVESMASKYSAIYRKVSPCNRTLNS